MKLRALNPSVMSLKTTNSLITGAPPNWGNFRDMWNNKPLRASLKISHHSLSTRFFSYRSCSHTLASKNYNSLLENNHAVMCIRRAHTGGNNDDNPPSKSVVLYIQNPFRWLVNKLDFGMLRRAWDPAFRENEFKDGAKLAVSSITWLMSSNNFEDLDGLLTSQAINQLRHDVETKWSDVQRRNVCLTKDDIKVALPQRVRFQRIDERKFCDVDMLFLALKQSKYEGTNATIFMEIKVRFHRDYTEGLPPEWTVSMFRVTRFNILPR